MSDTELIVDALIRTAGFALVIAGLNFATTVFIDFNFLGRTPKFFQMFTALGALIGGADSGLWYSIKENLL